MSRKNLVPDDATVAERRHRCSRFWPNTSARSTAVPPPLRHLGPFEDLEAERSAVIVAETAYIRRRDELKARNEETLKKHRQAVNLAIDVGETPPPAPTLEESTDLPVTTTSLVRVPGEPEQPWTHDPTLERLEAKHCSIDAEELALLAERASHWKQEMPVPEARDRVEKAERELVAARKELAPLEAAIKAIDGVAEPLRLAREKSADNRVRAEERDAWDGVWQEIGARRTKSTEADALMAEAAGPSKSSKFSRR